MNNNQTYMKSFQKGEQELIKATMERARSGKTKGSDNQMDRTTNKFDHSKSKLNSSQKESVLANNPKHTFSLTPSDTHNHNQGQSNSAKNIVTPQTGSGFKFNYTKKKQAIDNLGWEKAMNELNIQQIKY